MVKIENNDLNVEMRIMSIELLKESLQLPAISNTVNSTFNFNISLENKADASKNLVFVIVHVEIKNDDQPLVLGSISVSCIFEITNFNEVIEIESNGKYNMPQRLIETLNIISISTTRGIMFSTFKGTFLHGAVLPMVDPSVFKPEI